MGKDDHKLSEQKKIKIKFMIGVILNRRNLITQALDQSSDEQSLLNTPIPKKEWDYVQQLITENKIEKYIN